MPDLTSLKASVKLQYFRYKLKITVHLLCKIRGKKFLTMHITISCFKFRKHSIEIKNNSSLHARATRHQCQTLRHRQLDSTELELFAGKLTANFVYLVVAQNLCVIYSLKSLEETSKLRQDRNLSGECVFSGRNTKYCENLRMKDYLPSEEIVLQCSEQLELVKIQPSKSSVLLKVPNLELIKEKPSLFIPVNEFKKVQQGPQRILPCLPPVVQEILRWSIHPQEVLRGAASVRHLWSLPTIEEEKLPSVQKTEAKSQSEVATVEEILPSGLPTENRALLSNQARAGLKTLAKFRAEFRRRMLPTLSTIKEITSPIPHQVDSMHLADKAFYKLKRSRVQDMCQSKTTEETLPPAKKKELLCAKSKEKEGPKRREIKPVVNETQSTLPLLAKLHRPSKTVLTFHLSTEEGGLNPRQPELPRILAARESLIPVPPSTPKPTIWRKRPKIQTTVDRMLPSIQLKQGPMTPKPPSKPKPTQMHPKIQSTLTRPLPNVQEIQETTLPKPPSTLKPTVIRRRPSRLLPSIPQAKKRVLPLCFKFKTSAL